MTGEHAEASGGRSRGSHAALDRAFTETGGVVVHAVHGLGGIGESTPAAHWAGAQTGTYNPVWWITAETEADLDDGLAELAVALQPALGDVLSRRALRDVAVRWLAARTGSLLVLDNVSAPADVRGLVGRYLLNLQAVTGDMTGALASAEALVERSGRGHGLLNHEGWPCPSSTIGSGAWRTPVRRGTGANP
ncbi:hypothetical protein OHV08_22245 [Streptomyces canus]|uniref:hypothetical protein n=1 Tax=Streptomyces canus TaxID=58343 RepID=UPI00324D4BFB